MDGPLRLVLAVHNHQPVGNFDAVVEQTYQDAYWPFLRTFAAYPTLRISLHVSGSLWDWLERRHPEYLDEVAALARAGRIEILGGARYEPILPMIPRRDRRGQIDSLRRVIERRTGCSPLGFWLPERVWEQSLASDLAAAGVEHVVLDDCRFREAGLRDEELHGYYLTEDDGGVIAVLPGSEQLRYLIPFAPPEATIDYLRAIAERQPGAVAVFGDDGEKFGAWPGMREHVHERGWLTRFFDALAANADWLQVTTLAEVVNHVPPRGTIYLPDGSYREMMEWADISTSEPRGAAQSRASVPAAVAAPAGEGSRVVPRGQWRNFRVKYPEAAELYARMLLVSRRLARAGEAGVADDALAAAREALYRAQCNCGYWHGTFGGVYLAHLRQAIYRHLIAAENSIDRVAGRDGPWVEALLRDLNQDVHKEILLSNEHLTALVAPEQGGRLYELDVRAIGHNLLATLARWPEPYHAGIPAAAPDLALPHAADHWDAVRWTAEHAAAVRNGHPSGHAYDAHTRKSLIDHFYDPHATLADVAAGRATELGDFVSGRYRATLVREAARTVARLSRRGAAAGWPIVIDKSLALGPTASSLEIEYRLSGLPTGRPLHFAVEFNFAGLPADQPDRYFVDRQGRPLGHLGSELALAETSAIRLVDRHLGLSVGLDVSTPAEMWTFPIHTLSRYERGYQRLHQSTVVMPHWLVTADRDGCWSTRIALAIDGTAGLSRLATLCQADARPDLGDESLPLSPPPRRSDHPTLPPPHFLRERSEAGARRAEREG